jgi:hypothetical protein
MFGRTRTTQAVAPKPVRLTGWGITADVPGHWEGRLFNRPAPTAEFAGLVDESDPSGLVSAQRMAGPEMKAGALGWRGERTAPVLHLANFGMGSERGDFGSGVVGTMGPRHAFVALLEYGPELAGTPLFEPRGVPRPRQADFSPDCLQRRLPGQLGYQRFFTVGSRAMCLFVVLGSAGNARTLVTDVHDTLDAVEVSP